MTTPIRIVRGAALAAAIVLTASDCSSAAISRLVGTPAYLVYLTPGSPQLGSNGSVVYLTADNEGAATAYIRPCGDAPALDVQLQVNGQWQSQAAVACPQQTVPGPIPLDIAQTLTTSHTFTKGHWRVGIFVGTSAAMSDAAESYTVGFDIN